ncbi:hypothetical protein [Neoaquamicrobium sediminum]|uniref:hypothetical protein n=1 Tax=Neoaquamicrobium sediminum TaxID=1849104 RepID=UPI003BA88C64
MTLRILAIDDRDPASILMEVGKANAHEVVALSSDDSEKTELKAFLKQLFGAAETAFKGEPENADTSHFNEFDLVLLDFGLTTLGGFGVRLTAEHLAGYIRALTDVPYVVSLNKLGEVDFDLKYLLGDFDTRADLALNTELLSTTGLWSDEAEDGAFCPWYWPRLNEAARRRRAQIDFVKQHLDQPILESLGFPTEVIEQLSLQAIAFLSPEAEDGQANGPGSVRDVTFWQHFRSSNRTLIRDDRCGLFGGPNAAIPETIENVDDSIKMIAARVVAGELDFWFRRDILGPQRLLIDAPHLQAKYRFRPGEGDKVDPKTWSATVKESAPEFGLATEFYGVIAEFEFQQTHEDVGLIWTDKPCFWLPKIENCQAFTELAERHPMRHNNLVFCEDTRRFVDMREAVRFETALGRGIDIRYIQKLAGYNYSPKSQLAR